MADESDDDGRGEDDGDEYQKNENDRCNEEEELVVHRHCMQFEF